MARYNITRYVEQLLEQTESSPPSFTVHLHSEYWVLNNGSKFLYNNQIASLLDDIKAHRIPVDFLELFESARVPFYEGCMVVELLDYRPRKSSDPALKNPDKTRVVLHPNPETLWADICSLNRRNGGRWTDMDALEIEAKLLLATSQPLCLDPDPHLTRIANNVLRASTPSMPLSLKRKSSAMEPEEDGPEKAKRERLLGFMAPRDNRLHAPSYRLLDAIAVNKQKKEAIKASVAHQHGTQYMTADSQSVQPVPPHTQPTHTPQPTLSATSPQDHGEIPTQMIDTPQTFNVPFRSNGAHTPAPQPTQQYGQHPPAGTLQPNMIQPQVYANLQAAQEAAIKRVATPAQLQQTQAYQHYVQYPYSQQLQQQQPHQAPAQPQLPRPPSQPQRLQTPQPSTQTLPSPQPPTQQLNAQLGQPQRYTQTPKPPQVQPTTIQPAQTQHQQPTLSASPYQGVVPNPHFLQPAASARPIQRPPQGQTGAIQHPQTTLPTNANPSQSQHLYNPQLQQGQPSLQQQQAQLYLHRMGQAVPSGRTTPGQPQQSPRVQPQTVQPNRTVAVTPSPAKGSPVVHQQTIQPTASSPMQTKAQIPIQIPTQSSGSVQSLPVLGQPPTTQQTQQPGAQQQQQLNPGGMLQAQRYQFQSQYGHSQLRPLVHGNPQMVGATGTPTMAHASPVVGGRPLTPADGKPQTNQAQQQPIRRPTPLQQPQPGAMAQMPAHLVKQQQQTPQLQPQQLPQSQQPQAQGQQMQGQAQLSPHVQQANLAVQQQQLQHHQMNAYAQMYGFPPYWRVTPQQQQQQQQGQTQQSGTAAATGLQLSPQLASMPTQQQLYYQQHLGLLVNQIQQSQGAAGRQLTHQQMQQMAHNKLMQAAQTQQSVGQLGGQQMQGGQPIQQSQQAKQSQQQMSNAQLQATMMGKMQMQMGPQIHMQQGISGVVGGHGQTANMSPVQMHMPHFQQPQHHSPIPQTQHGGQQKVKTTAVKKGPSGR